MDIPAERNSISKFTAHQRLNGIEKIEAGEIATGWIVPCGLGSVGDENVRIAVMIHARRSTYRGLPHTDGPLTE